MYSQVPFLCMLMFRLCWYLCKVCVWISIQRCFFGLRFEYVWKQGCKLCLHVFMSCHNFSSALVVLSLLLGWTMQLTSWLQMDSLGIFVMHWPKWESWDKLICKSCQDGAWSLFDLQGICVMRLHTTVASYSCCFGVSLIAQGHIVSMCDHIIEYYEKSF